MYPRYFNNQLSPGDQLQSGSLPRTDPRFQQNNVRPQQIQNPYSSINTGSGVSAAQYDPRFANGISPAMPPNASAPYGMISNSYQENAKAMQMSYERGIYPYPMPMQMMDMRVGAYQNMGPYYPYYGMRQGVAYQGMERPMVPGYPQEFSNPMMQEKAMPPPVTTPAIKTATPQAIPAPSTEQTVVNGKDVEKQPELKDAVMTTNPPSQETAPKETVTKEDTTAAITSGKCYFPFSFVDTDSIEKKLAMMLLQIRGKHKEANSQTIRPQVENPSTNSSTNTAGNANTLNSSSGPSGPSGPLTRGYPAGMPSLAQHEDKRVHTENPYPYYSAPYATMPVASQTYLQSKVPSMQASQRYPSMYSGMSVQVPVQPQAHPSHPSLQQAQAQARMQAHAQLPLQGQAHIPAAGGMTMPVPLSMQASPLSSLSAANATANGNVNANATMVASSNPNHSTNSNPVMLTPATANATAANNNNNNANHTTNNTTSNNTNPAIALSATGVQVIPQTTAPHPGIHAPVGQNYPPIPSPLPPHQSARPGSSIADYYVFCTVCRHGTPINVTKPLPDHFKCSNCGLSCVLDKHLLSYYVGSHVLDELALFSWLGVIGCLWIGFQLQQCGCFCSLLSSKYYHYSFHADVHVHVICNCEAGDGGLLDQSV